MDLIGLVMAGGRSSRMGRDKGRELFDKVPMAVRVHGLLTEMDLPVLVSVNAEQVPEYERLFPTEALVVDSVLSMGGPLRGVLSAHVLHPEADILVVACDMPLLGRSVLERILSERIAHSVVPYIAFDSDGIQPLCALYRSAALAALLSRVEEAGTNEAALPPFCPRRLMSSDERTLLIPARTESERLQFTNVNRPEELAAARAVVEAG